MTNTEYNKLLKYLYFEGYANSYEEADYILEDMSNIERKQLMMEAFHPIYGRGGQKRKTQTALQVLGKYASPKDKKTKHNIPKGGTTITPGDPYGGRLGTGEYDRGKGSKAKRRLAALQSNKPKNFPNRLRRADGQGIKDSYEFLSDYLIDEGYTNTVDGALTIIENMSDDWMESILEAYKRLPVGKMMRKVEYRAEREADTRAEREREADNPNSILGYDRAKKAHERAERDKERSNEMIRVADTHSKKEAKSKSKYKK